MSKDKEHRKSSERSIPIAYDPQRGAPEGPFQTDPIPPEMIEQSLKEHSAEEIAALVEKLKAEGGGVELDSFIPELEKVVQEGVSTKP